MGTRRWVYVLWCLPYGTFPPSPPSQVSFVPVIIQAVPQDLVVSSDLGVPGNQRHSKMVPFVVDLLLSSCSLYILIFKVFFILILTFYIFIII